MAQWSGQFSGNTHLSKVRDLEHQLQHAVDAYRTIAAETEIQPQAEVVLRFAEKLLNARVRANKARIAACDPRDTEDRTRGESKNKRMLDAGIPAILKEFGVPEIFVD